MTTDGTPASPAGRGPIRRRRIHEEVASRVRALIADAGLAPGDRLPSERELMAEFGVGRSAVREAMLTLQRAGVVVVSSGERARVARPSARAFLDELSGAARLLLAESGGAERLADARVLLEAGLARYAAQRASAGDVATLRELLEASRRAAAAGDPDVLARCDAAFRFGVAAAARNDLLTALLEAVSGWLASGRRSGPAGGGGGAVAAHERILAAVAAGDPDAAARAMQEHLAGPGGG